MQCSNPSSSGTEPHTGSTHSNQRCFSFPRRRTLSAALTSPSALTRVCMKSPSDKLQVTVAVVSNAFLFPLIMKYEVLPCGSPDLNLQSLLLTGFKLEYKACVCFYLEVSRHT